MAAGTDLRVTPGTGADALLDPDDPFRIWRELQEPVDDRVAEPHTSEPGLGTLSPTLDDLRALADLDDPRLVLSEGYVGVDRRRPGGRWALTRAAHVTRRALFRLDVLVILAVVVVLVGAGLLVTSRPGTAPRPEVTAAAQPATQPATQPTTQSRPRPHTPTTVPAVAAVTTPPAVAPAPAAPVVDPSSPTSMGAAALALVRYPWQQLPGYSIQFLPISEAPSPGFYGNTTFTWGKPGGVSTMYVYPGETVDKLAGITAFEVGHEVDAAYVEPQGGHDQIAGILGIHPASWAPECDCAEQGYLSGWYSAAFSDYWSPGVGAWSTLAPPPTGATLDALRPWLDPRVS
jgi:hypothetical protein